MAYDPAVIRAIQRIARKRGMDEEAVLGALSTGIVESGLQELGGGDQDSYGWRQQRESIYGKQGLSKSINNFFDEWEQFDKPGFNPGLTAANVQRPREDLRGKYADVLDEARKILGGDWSGGRSSSVSMPPVSSQQPQQQNPFGVIAELGANMPQNPYSANLQRGWEMLGQIWDQKNQPQPQLRGAPVGVPLPGGGQPGAIRRGLHEAFFDPVGGYDEGRSIGAIGGHSDHAHFGGNPAAIANIVRRAQRNNLTVREYAPVDPVDPVHAKGSWHDKFGGRGGADVSGDPSDLAAFFKRMLKRAGWR